MVKQDDSVLLVGKSLSDFTHFVIAWCTGDHCVIHHVLDPRPSFVDSYLGLLCEMSSYDVATAVFLALQDLGFRVEGLPKP